MNPMTNVKNVLKLSERELTGNSKSSWHDQYKDSAWIFVGGLPYDLTEGDVICVFSQYGEIVNINLVRDKDTGRSKGFAFICYEDQRSTILAVDNLNSIKILGRTIRVDHCEQYRAPNADMSKIDEVTAAIRTEGCAPALLPQPVPEVPVKTEKEHKEKKKKHKEKKSKKKKKKRSKSNSDSSDSD
ncbi:RNA-binding motif protein, X-linked 2 [Danaus plexippus]|uniref:RNA-binding motif protein, X-linked 2 n=1 Tax=Danaus plexippus plexippus TaxID=278856 RepID=A0A212ESE9_DANPL|nr:RNA-binding motif protein, X-linked 2 [Danaus plexippus]OWR44407.1 RNA binding motif protein X-linked 2 [Danaus plexippus plexippus]